MVGKESSVGQFLLQPEVMALDVFYRVLSLVRFPAHPQRPHHCLQLPLACDASQELNFGSDFSFSEVLIKSFHLLTGHVHLVSYCHA